MEMMPRVKISELFMLIYSGFYATFTGLEWEESHLVIEKL